MGSVKLPLSRDIIPAMVAVLMTLMGYGICDMWYDHCK